MIIYKKDNSVRLQVHQSDDSEMIQEISGEEYVLFKFESNVFTTFEVGDYITVYGQTFTLKKVVAQIETKIDSVINGREYNFNGIVVNSTPPLS